MAAQPETGLVFEDLYAYPQDRRKRELIGGRLYVSPEPRLAHQKVIANIVVLVRRFCDEHGGEVYPGANVDPLPGTHFEPDVVGIGSQRPVDSDGLRIFSPPDLLVEVSSPSTRSYDLDVKHPEYERHGVREFWFVDLDEAVVLVHRLGSDGYGVPERYAAGDTFQSDSYPGLVIAVDDVLR